LTYWTPSPCTKLSSARTTTGPPPHSHGPGSATDLPTTGLAARWEGDRGWFPRSPLDHSFREAPSYIPVASPRLRRRPSPWPPARPLQPGPELTTHLLKPVGDCALQTGPYPPGLSRHVAYGTSTTGSLALRLLNSLDGPASSGRADTSRRCQGCFPPSPTFPGSGCPQLHQAAATACWQSSFTSTWSSGTSWRT
jgi:hypothetical protein